MLQDNDYTSQQQQAAGAIHTDFERGFICAEVMHYDELKEIGNEQGALPIFVSGWNFSLFVLVQVGVALIN